MSDVKQRILLELVAQTESADKKLRTTEKITTDAFGNMTKRVTVYDTALRKSTTTVEKLNQGFADRMKNFGKANEDSLAKLALATTAVGLAAKGLGAAFDLALGSAKRNVDANSLAFTNAYASMNKSILAFKDALGSTLMPALTDVATALGAIVRGIVAVTQAAGFVLGGGPLDVARDAANNRKLLAGQSVDDIGIAISGARGSLQQQEKDASRKAAQQFSDAGRDFVNGLQATKSLIGHAIDRGLSRDGGGRGTRKPTQFFSDLQFRGTEIEGPPDIREPTKAFSDGTGAAFAKSEHDSFVKAQVDQATENMRVLDAQMNQIRELSRTANFARNDSILRQIFGPPEELGFYQTGITTLASSFDLLTTAAGAGIEALITGQEGILKALKRSTAGALLAIAVQSGVEALKHTAMAIGTLAFGNVPGATLHFESAALHAGVAVAAGVGARALGAGQPVSTGGAGAGAHSGGGSAVQGIGRGGQGGGSRNVTIVLGSDFAEDSPRVRQHRLSKAIQQANRQASSTIEFD